MDAPSPAVGAPALGQPDPFAGRPLDTPELLLRHPRETARHDRSGSDAPGCCPATPLGTSAPSGSRSRRCSGVPGPIGSATAQSTGPVRRGAALHARAWTVSITPDLQSANGSPEPSNAAHSDRVHHRVKTGILLASLEAPGLKAALRPRHYRDSAHHEDAEPLRFRPSGTIRR